METELMVVLICISFFVTIFLSLYFYLMGRNKERMALIEAGQDLSQFYKKRNRNISIWLRVGIFAMGMGIGFLIIGLMKEFGLFINGQLKTAIIVIFGGLAMIIANYVDKPKQEQH